MFSCCFSRYAFMYHTCLWNHYLRVYLGTAVAVLPPGRSTSCRRSCHLTGGDYPPTAAALGERFTNPLPQGSLKDSRLSLPQLLYDLKAGKVNPSLPLQQ